MRRLLLSASLALLFAPVPALAQAETGVQEVVASSSGDTFNISAVLNNIISRILNEEIHVSTCIMDIGNDS